MAKITVFIDSVLLDKASTLVGEKEPEVLIRMALEVLIKTEAAKKLSAPGGTQLQLKPVRRRRLDIE